MKPKIYVLANSMDPSVVKVGMTENLHRRVGQMNSLSSTVGEWSPLASFDVQEGLSLEDAERAALEALQEFKVFSRREQFRMDHGQAVEEVRSAVSIYHLQETNKLIGSIKIGSIAPNSDTGRAAIKLQRVVLEKLKDENGVVPEWGAEETERREAWLQDLEEAADDEEV